MATLAGCGGGQTGTNLAADQTLRFAIINDLTSLDPAHVDSAVDITFLNEVFTGLYRFDNQLNIVPAGASALPDISSDGLTWTFHLRKDLQFSNGDKITAKDWVWTWTRTLHINDAYASNLEAIAGAAEVENGTAKTLTGLSAPDDYTLVAKLHDPAGYWLTQLAMPTATLVLDRKIIEATGGSDPYDTASHWTESASTYVGSGPFKLTARTPKQSMDFAAMSNWWGGSTGHLTKVHTDVNVDVSSQVQKLEAGGYDLVGMANAPPGPDDVLRYKNDPAKSKLLTIYPGGRTTGVGFNFINGPFAAKQCATPSNLANCAGKQTNGSGISDPGLDGRIAFSMSIDRNQYTDVACVHAITCQPATGGILTKGFKGYLGDGADPYAKFDVAAAKQHLDKWDPDGSKRKNLHFRYNSSPANDKRFQNLQSQWKANLGVDVTLDISDFPTLQRDRKAKRWTFGRDSWGIDYDNPQDWFDNLYTCDQAQLQRGNNEAFCNPDLDKIVAQADAKPIAQALPLYKQALQILTNAVVWAPMDYGTQPYIVASYVKGTGYNGLYDYNWEGISILQH